jgi:Skp family chaperone for outer membrane proteins
MKQITLVVLLTLGGLAAHASAQAPAAAATQVPQVPATPPNPGTKVAVMDFQSALFDSDPGKAAVAEIEKGLAQTKASFDKLSKEMGDLQTKLQNAKTDAEKSTINRDLESKTTEGKRLQEDGQRLSETLQEKHLAPVAELLRKTVNEYGLEKNLALILDPTTDGTNIVYAAKSSDITSEVMRRMNEAFAKDPKIVAPGSAPAPTAPPKANN